MHEHVKFAAAKNEDMRSDTERDWGTGNSSLSGSRDEPIAAGDWRHLHPD